jgi:RNA polymerase sigma-70 factor (ECF subfamily)
MNYAPDKKDWFKEFKAGNGLAFKYYFELHYQTIFYHSYKLVQAVESAEDMVSLAFEKLWGNRDRIQTENHILAFLREVAKNYSLNHIKREGRKQAGEDELRHLNNELDNTDLFNEMVAAETTRKIYEAIEKLPRKCKAVFKLLYYEQVSTKEAAEQLGISERNVLNQKARGILLLRGLLTGFIIFFLKIVLIYRPHL